MVSYIGANLDRNDISRAVQLASLLEVSAPKPGNVNRYHDMEDLSFEQFLGASISIGPTCKKSYEKRGENIGKLIKEAVSETNKWQTGRNPNFGIITLAIPICSTLGKIEKDFENVSINEIGEKVTKNISNTNNDDAINYYRALRKANPKGIDEVDKYDFKKDSGIHEIKEDDLNLLDIFKISKDRETVMKDLTNGLEIIGNEAYPKLKRTHKKTKDLSGSITETFLKILSQHPDSLIQRKASKKRAIEVSKRSKRILENGGFFNNKAGLKEFDKYLRNNSNLNPGTTADIIFASLLFLIIKKNVKP